jgi:hypothetical protein
MSHARLCRHPWPRLWMKMPSTIRFTQLIIERPAARLPIPTLHLWRSTRQWITIDVVRAAASCVAPCASACKSVSKHHHLSLVPNMGEAGEQGERIIICSEGAGLSFWRFLYNWNVNNNGLGTSASSLAIGETQSIGVFLSNELVTADSWYE